MFGYNFWYQQKRIVDKKISFEPTKQGFIEHMHFVADWYYLTDIQSPSYFIEPMYWCVVWPRSPPSMLYSC